VVSVSDAARWVPAEVDLTRPNAARMYDRLLGGGHNFAVDRLAIDKVLAVAPEVRTAALANRAFLRRAVTHLATNGIRQFVDLGSGIPTVGNVHEIAQAVDPAARVVYVDNEPVAYAHARALLEDMPTASVIHRDIREPAAILNHDDTKRLIDFSQPVGLLLVSVLHFVPGDVTGLVAELRRPLAAGSYLVVSHATLTTSTAQTDAVQELYARTPTPLQLRSRDQIRTVFDGLDLVHAAPAAHEPADLVPIARWRPDPNEAALPDDVAASPFLTGFLAGVGRVPTPQGGRR
jgi:hypothetical protein